MRCLCRGYEEGRADFTKVAGTLLENVRPEYRPSLHYPADYGDSSNCSDGSEYYRAAPFTALYSELAFVLGHTRALQYVYDHVGTVDENTAMVCWQASGGVGPCTTSVSTLPSNSYYRKMLDTDAALCPGAGQSAAEISAVFHNRVKDGDPSDSDAMTTYPWKDDIPNTDARGPLLPATEFATSTSYSDGPHTGTWGTGELKLDYWIGSHADHDSFAFIARAGETYRVESLWLGGTADTVLEILDLSGEVLASNDDCTRGICSWCRTNAQGGSNGLASCVQFVPNETKTYVARLRPYSANTLGTYDIRFELQGDDLGDTRSAGNPAPAGSQTYQMNTSGDEDWIRIYAADGFSVTACSANFVPRVRVYQGESQTPVADTTVGSCPGSPLWVGVAQPSYYNVQVTSNNGATGAWSFSVNNPTDQDLDYGLTYAIPLTLAADQGTSLTLNFETAQDEDWLALDAVPGYVYNLTTDAPTGLIPKLELYAPKRVGIEGTGTPPAYDNPTMFTSVLKDWQGIDSSGQGLGMWMMADVDSALGSIGSALTFTAPVRGMYYVRVSEVAHQTGAYRVLASRSHYAHATFLAYP